MIDIKELTRLDIKPDEILAIGIDADTTESQIYKFSIDFNKRYPDIDFFTYPIGAMEFTAIKKKSPKEVPSIPIEPD